MYAKTRGFTLIELMVVIAIIGILASIITTSLGSARAKGRDAKRISDIRTLQLALEEYYNDNGAFPNTMASLAPNYMASIPCDPDSGSSCSIPYKYTAYNLTSVSGGSSNCGIYPRVKYHLAAVLEDTTNPALNQDSDFAAGASYTACSSSGADFNGTAANCSGTTGALTDNCYDVTN